MAPPPWGNSEKRPCLLKTAEHPEFPAFLPSQLPFLVTWPPNKCVVVPHFLGRQKPFVFCPGPPRAAWGPRGAPPVPPARAWLARPRVGGAGPENLKAPRKTPAGPRAPKIGACEPA